jgi:hypothetical protein
MITTPIQSLRGPGPCFPHPCEVIITYIFGEQVIGIITSRQLQTRQRARHPTSLCFSSNQVMDTVSKIRDTSTGSFILQLIRASMEHERLSILYPLRHGTTLYGTTLYGTE